MLKKILIANRGEIAVRIIQACREMDITAAALYSEVDRDSLHVRTADEAYYLGPAPASESYLNMQKIIHLAKKINADAIHPGYGFLSENAEFIEAVESTGLIFIGPSAKSVKLMGNKTSARNLMKESGIPIVPGTLKPITSVTEAIEVGKKIGFPVMLKAAAGGGGKGMRKVLNSDEFSSAFERASNEALKAFGNSDIYIEKFIEDPKHIEVQILGDKFGNYVHLFERECSIQRRHQKVIEESPSPSINSDIRDKITKAAVAAARSCGYYNAGTIEFLMDKNKKFYFLEMNTRLQVEHPVTEMVTGVDLVKEQIYVASGEKLRIKQEDLKINNHSLECRIYAEDVDNNFSPSIGKINYHRAPTGAGIRVDRGIDDKSEISVYYDPMLAKVITWGKTRQDAINRMKIALSEYQIAGVTPNFHFLLWVLNNKKFLDASFNIDFIENEFLPKKDGKWKDDCPENYEDVVSILGALLKNEQNKLTPIKLNGCLQNRWEELNCD